MVLPTDAASWANYSAVRNQAPDSIALLAPGTAPSSSAAAGSPQRLGGVLPILPANAPGPQLRAAPDDGQPADAVRHRQAPGHRAEHRPAGDAHHQGAVRVEHAPASRRACSRTTTSRTPGRRWRPRAPRAAGAGAWATCLRRPTASRCSPRSRPSGNAVWLAGESIQQYQVGTNGAIRMGTDANGRIFGSADVGAAMQRIVSATRGTHVFERDLAALGKRSHRRRAGAAHRAASRPATPCSARRRWRPRPTTPTTTRSCSTTTR